MKIHLFTISTGIYNNYLKYLIPTIDNLYPGVEKSFNIISDNEYRINLNEHVDYTESNYYHICNLPYPFIPYFKVQYICDMINQYNYSNYDYMIYCDVDSYFLKKTDDYFRNLFNDDNKLHCSLSPYIYKPHFDILKNEMEYNKNSITYIEGMDKNNYCQSSLFFCNINKLKNVNNVLMNYISADSKNRIISQMFDQSLFNKYIYEHKEDVVEKHYICNSYGYNGTDDNYYDCNNWFPVNDLKSEIFCIQKYNWRIKEVKRNSNKFNDEI